MTSGLTTGIAVMVSLAAFTAPARAVEPLCSDLGSVLVLTGNEIMITEAGDVTIDGAPYCTGYGEVPTDLVVEMPSAVLTTAVTARPGPDIRRGGLPPLVTTPVTVSPGGDLGLGSDDDNGGGGLSGVVGGHLILNGGVITLAGAGGVRGGSVTTLAGPGGGGTFALSAVPEPGVWALLILGFGGVAHRLRGRASRWLVAGINR